MLNEKVICAGFGGQGVMSMGQLLTYAGMIEDKQVSWLPSYGSIALLENINVMLEMYRRDMTDTLAIVQVGIIANMVMLGAYIELTNVVEFESLHKALQKVFGERKAHLIEVNKEALQRGAALVK